MKVEKITRTNGVAGQFQYAAVIRYPYQEDARTVVFVGTEYGSRVVMVTEGWPGGLPVDDPQRFGPKLDAAWVRNFFASK